MNLNEYQNSAMSFRLPSAQDADYALYGLSGEVGELHSLIAKTIRDGAKPDMLDLVKKELGDILWFVAAIAKDFDYDLETVATANIDKLQSRQIRNALQGSGDNR